eukprot:9743336-Karenia_brevis.AAC.1
MVSTLVQQVATAGLGDANRLMQEYDKRTQDATVRFLARLPEQSAAEAKAVLHDCLLSSSVAWEKLLRGAEEGSGNPHSLHAQRLRGTRGSGI